ncbi:hypothetical protein FXW78_46135 [Rhodococcus opacus]|nr:hypothetical protein [Rhodococcus opacus]
MTSLPLGPSRPSVQDVLTLGGTPISTVDVETRHTRKSKSNRRDGFRGHVAAEPETGLITDCELTKASGEAGSDPVVGEQMISRDRYHRVDVDADAADNPQPDAADEQQGRGLQVYGDSAYGTGEARAAYRAAGHDTVIKPKPLRPAVDGGFTLDDFTVDEAGGTVTCPAGHSRPMSPKRTVTFGRVCAGCPLRSRCTTAQDGRSMTIHPHGELLRAARARARTPQFKQDYPTRSTVERIIAWPRPRTAIVSSSATSASARTTPGSAPVVHR